MLKFIEFLKKRPKDNTIRFIRVLIGLLILLLLGLYFEDLRLEFLSGGTSPQTVLYIKYSLFILGILPILFGVLNPCIAKRKYIKIAQIVFGLALIVLGNYITVEKPIIVTDKVVNNTGSIDASTITSKAKESKRVNIGFFIALIGVLQMIGGISGKCITSKCIKHGETITKIRV